MTVTDFAGVSPCAGTAQQGSGLAVRLTWRSQVKAQSAGRNHKPRNLAKSVTVTVE